MFLLSFWEKYQNLILLSLISIGFLLSLLIIRKNKNPINVMISTLIVLLLIVGMSFVLSFKNLEVKNIIIIDFVILLTYSIIGYLVFTEKREVVRTTLIFKISFMGVMIGLATILQMLGFPLFPGFEFLKVELTGLVFILILIWFDFKTTVVVIFLTNLIHVLLSSSSPLIPVLDEMINVIANVAFLLPTAVIINNFKSKEPSRKLILLSTIIGVIFTTLFMVLYNAYFNLPIIYKFPLSVKDTFYYFGAFNIVKWGLVTIAINLLWPYLYNIRNIAKIK